MVRQGDIIKVDLPPQAGHGRAGYRPAVVISNDFFNRTTQLVIVCPVANIDNKFPLHIPLDSRTKTAGVILCEHALTLDLTARSHQLIEQLPKDILKTVIDTVFAEIEIL